MSTEEIPACRDCYGTPCDCPSADDLIRELANLDPVHPVPEWYGEMHDECFFCEAEDRYDFESKTNVVKHERGCLWDAVQKLMKRKTAK